MADPLSVIAGITGVSIACAQLASVVYTACDRTRYAPASTREIASSMSLLSSILDSQAEVLAKGQGLYKAQVLENTNTILKRIKGIQREVRRMVKQKSGVRARLNWAFFDYSKVRELSERIEALKSALNLVLSTLQLAIAQEGREKLATTLTREHLSTLVACAIRASRQSILELQPLRDHTPLSSPGALPEYKRPSTGRSAPNHRSSQHVQLPNISRSENIPDLDPKLHRRPREHRKQMNSPSAPPPPPRSPRDGPISETSSGKSNINVDRTAAQRSSRRDKSGLHDDSLEYGDWLSDTDGYTSLYGHSASQKTFGNELASTARADTASWLYQMVFQPKSKHRADLKASSTDAPRGQNAAINTGETIREQAKAAVSTHHDERKLDFGITPAPPPKYLYGLSVRDTVKGLMKEWTYIKPSDLPLQLNAFDDVNRLYDSGSSESSDGDNSDSSESMSMRSKHSGPPPSLGERAFPSRSLGAHIKIRPEAKDKDSCKDSLLKPPTKRSTNQDASDPDFIKPNILDKLEKAVREVGDEMKKAEKSRKRIEESSRLEEHAWFDRVENLLLSRDRFLRVQAAENKMITHDAEKKAAKQQTEQTERFKHLENMIVAHRVAYMFKEAAEAQQASAATIEVNAGVEPDKPAPEARTADVGEDVAGKASRAPTRNKDATRRGQADWRWGRVKPKPRKKKEMSDDAWKFTSRNLSM